MTQILHHANALSYFSRLARAALVRLLSRRRRAMQAARIACFPGDDIGDRIIANGWYEDVLLQALFERFLIEDAAAFRQGVALDVGANIGNHSLWFARRFAQVLAFEPNPICIHLFEANRLMNGVGNMRLFDIGLSDAAGEKLFHSNQTGNLGRSGVGEALAATATRSFPVRLERGDDLLTDAVLAGLPVRLVKLDIEGHELAALMGLQSTLQRFEPLVLFESHHAGGEAGSDAIVSQLQAWGYRHFYVLEANASPYRGRLAKFVYRLVKGWNLTVRAVERPDDRSYSLVIAATRPRCES